MGESEIQPGGRLTGGWGGVCIQAERGKGPRYPRACLSDSVMLYYTRQEGPMRAFLSPPQPLGIVMSFPAAVQCLSGLLQLL